MSARKPRGKAAPKRQLTFDEASEAAKLGARIIALREKVERIMEGSDEGDTVQITFSDNGTLDVEVGHIVAAVEVEIANGVKRLEELGVAAPPTDGLPFAGKVDAP